MQRKKTAKKKNMQQGTNDPQALKRRFTKRDFKFVCIVIAINLFLNLLGFGWGMDGQVPWSADAIEGITTVREIPKLFNNWTYKYPRLQFLIDGLCYKPWIKHWEQNPVYVQRNGHRQAQVLTLARLNTLAIISRINILIMSVFIILFTYLLAKFYYADSMAAFLASLSLAVCFIFVYYSHTTCVDIPSMLWISGGVYFLVKSIYLNKLSCHLWSGVFFAFACCTKDAMLVYAFSFSVVYIAFRILLQHKDGILLKTCFISIINRNTVLAFIVFLFLFTLLQNILTSPGAYWERMGVWVGGRGVKDFNRGFQGQIPLLLSTLNMFYWSLGWPLVVLVLVSFIYTLPKHKLFNLGMILFPLLFFYLFISMRIKMSFIRYYLPVMGLMFLPVGKFASELLNIKKAPLSRVCAAILGIFFVILLSYCISLDLELINDPRNQTAKWFKANVSQGTPVLSLIQRPYGPKLVKHGYPVIENWKVPSLERLLANKNQLPEFLILSTDWFTIRSKEAKDLRKALLNNNGGYEKIAQFTGEQFLNPRKNVLSVASWPFTPKLGTGPFVTVMKKEPE